jgi:hypothetical protein
MEGRGSRRCFAEGYLPRGGEQEASNRRIVEGQGPTRATSLKPHQCRSFRLGEAISSRASVNRPGLLLGSAGHPFPTESGTCFHRVSKPLITQQSESGGEIKTSIQAAAVSWPFMPTPVDLARSDRTWVGPCWARSRPLASSPRVLAIDRHLDSTPVIVARARSLGALERQAEKKIK